MEVTVAEPNTLRPLILRRADTLEGGGAREGDTKGSDDVDKESDLNDDCDKDSDINDGVDKERNTNGGVDGDSGIKYDGDKRY